MSRDRHRKTLDALNLARHSRDGFPAGYAAELRTLVAELAERLAVPDEVRDQALRAASLHELGKLGVDQTTLIADRSLSESELSEVRRAPLIAQELVEAMPGYEAAADAVRHANERWDGNGYPDGLAGEAVPLASRIVAVAGAFQAMSAPRPFRAAMHVRAIRTEISAGAGTQFDPRVVAAMLDLIGPRAG
ncbi:MAG: HD domain-containing phosphohydrolase [Solirubrobacterales bacterium]